MLDLLITETVSEAFAGWVFRDGDLMDPAGNRYRPEDLQASFYARKAWEARAGYPGELRFLRAELERRLLLASRLLVVEVWEQAPGGRRLLGRQEVGGQTVSVQRECVRAGVGG